MNTPIKYVAEPKHVREVSLHGTADLGFWKDRLEDEELVPAERDGKAQLLIVAADMRFMGVRFRELSFSVRVGHRQVGPPGDGALLVQAFNSSRLLALSERLLFSTPYRLGDVRVSASLPTSILLSQRGTVVFQATMEAVAATPDRQAARSDHDGWEGPIFLPSRRREKDQGRLFFGRIRGHTQTYPFLPSRDAMLMRPSPGSEVLLALLDSHFVGKQWAVRQDATHTRSKTYKRSEVFAG
jgi:hypothetical protein